MITSAHTTAFGRLGGPFVITSTEMTFAAARARQSPRQKVIHRLPLTRLRTRVAGLETPRHEPPTAEVRPGRR